MFTYSVNAVFRSNRPLFLNVEKVAKPVIGVVGGQVLGVAAEQNVGTCQTTAAIL